ncbi:hypothetical protein J416_14016 [Gracilibacillus halophilus YIM-C55.5]|uniref:Integral inner membrane protein n=1 Tax=Gracilibacillus halophilus YIM-C55.5 TaxID=1308866 RepID=N4W9A9_9BACI|nr:YndM family protein [Gracilibacillus halophilus]ENH95834.1 hypothetical protein J416_14016 [Gracilibacillus halophilus YIM-C55.5]
MEHLKNMLVKFIASFVLLYAILGVGFDVSFGNVLWITLVLGVLAYVLGDQLLLRRSNNTVSTISDFALAFLVIYFMTDALTVGDDVFQAALIAAIGVAIFEYFFHKYLAANTDEEETTDVYTDGNLQTETSEELHPDDKDIDDE